MQLIIDTSAPLTATDLAILGLLNGGPVTESESKADTLAPAKRAAAKKAPAAKPEPEPEPDADGPTLEDAVARAQELVGLKLTQGVKDAVKEIGAPRVSELKGDQIAEFLEAVKDLDADVV